MSTSPVQLVVDGSLATLTFSRPEARNAMTWEMYEALADACAQADADPSIRALILKGAGGKAFVSGTDIGQFTQFRTREDGLAYERRMDGVIDRLERVSKPTLAQIQGVATGGGFVIAVACDLRLCTPESRFGVPIARTLGNCLSAANCARLVDLVGPARAKDLLLTGRLMDATEALALGVVTRVVEAPSIEADARELALALAANAPLTIQATKEMVRRLCVHRRLEPSMDDDLIARCYTSDDFKEGVAAFLERRAPRFVGR